ncbi:defective chorion-1 protein, FC177 isoform-like, partial [Portunus trituberculatus]|uniref:defective chorion-1 protein, FC177 isoform-like n=1 Tax=Portunus trituberculatus TaxID=210409 RepID=UPI001E1D0ED4
ERFSHTTYYYNHTTTTPPTTTTTAKPSGWGWLGAVSGVARRIKTSVKSGLNATKHLTVRAGKAIGRGAVKVGSAIKSGYRKVKLKLSGSKEKFKIVMNRLKEKIEAGDERALELMRKLGIRVRILDGKVAGTELEEEPLNITTTATANATTASYLSPVSKAALEVYDEEEEEDKEEKEEEEEEEEMMMMMMRRRRRRRRTERKHHLHLHLLLTTTTPTTTTTTSYTTKTTTNIPTTTTTPTTTPTTTTTTTTDEPDRTVEEPYQPPPFPDVFSNARDRLETFYNSGGFTHEELTDVFNFDPENYEYVDYYEYEY